MSVNPALYPEEFEKELGKISRTLALVTHTNNRTGIKTVSNRLARLKSWLYNTYTDPKDIPIFLSQISSFYGSKPYFDSTDVTLQNAIKDMTQWRTEHASERMTVSTKKLGRLKKVCSGYIQEVEQISDEILKSNYDPETLKVLLHRLKERNRTLWDTCCSSL